MSKPNPQINTLYEIVLKAEAGGTTFTVNELSFTKKTDSNYLLANSASNKRFLTRIPVEQVKADFIQDSGYNYLYLTLLAYTEVEAEITSIKYRLQQEALKKFTHRVNFLKEILESVEKVEVKG